MDPEKPQVYVLYDIRRIFDPSGDSFIRGTCGHCGYTLIFEDGDHEYEETDIFKCFMCNCDLLGEDIHPLSKLT